MRIIIRRELLDHLQSFQFIAFLIICFVLFFINGAISADTFARQRSSYQQKSIEAAQSRSTVETSVYRQPSQLLFMAGGADSSIPKGYTLKPKGGISAQPAGPRNFKLPEVPELDWSFIIKAILSLFVILLGYNVISGEREQGTLCLVLANPIGRLRLFIAKYVAIILATLIPLAAGVLLSLLVVGSFIPQVLASTNIARILTMILISIAYLSIFALISMLISALIGQSSLCLLVLLVMWAIFVIIFPNLSGILSMKVSNVPSEYEVAKAIGPMIEKQIWANINAIAEKAENGKIATEEDLKSEADRVFIDGQDALVEHSNHYAQAVHARVLVARSISRLSPAALFQYGAESIARTGFIAEESFLQDITNYSRRYDAYILKKVGKLVRTSKWNFSIIIYFRGKPTPIQSPQPIEYSGSMEDFPPFTETEESLLDCIHRALFDLAGLLFWNLAAAVAGLLVFLRADVR